ncbi:MAG: dTDP-4-dehydrorhamnose reductase [Eubacteriales bacterium]|nr:dTDP-4-dehydrorhamnose reductase [Eubacteriales bacterium]
MDILITGGNGQLGSELSGILAAGRAEIGPLPWEYAGARVTSVDVDTLDIADNAAVEKFFAARQFDLILNCAAMTNVDGCQTDADAAMKANAIGPRNLARAADKMGAKLLHVSTDYVFAGDGDTPYAEWDVCTPKSVYGKSKHLGEQYVREQCRRYFIVRTSWLYGYRGGNFVKTIVKAGRERGALKVVNDQRGNPTNANDLAYHLLKIGVTDGYGIYHCTGNGECTWYDFACKIIELCGVECTVTPCTTAEFPSRTPRPAFSALDHGMLRVTVGDEMRRWQDALDCFMKNWKEGE